MATEHDIRHIDRRTVDRYVRRGEITQAEFEKHLKNLPDLADKADVVPLEQPTSNGVPTR